MEAWLISSWAFAFLCFAGVRVPKSNHKRWMIVLSEESLKQAFGSIWWRFLEFEITRSRLMCEFAGNPVNALILQVVAYHNLTLVQASIVSENYSEIRSKWEKNDIKGAGDLPLKLSYASIADLTGIDKETVRRAVKKLAEQRWLQIDQKTGIHYNPTQLNQEKLVLFNEWEIAQLGRLLKRVTDSQITN